MKRDLKAISHMHQNRTKKIKCLKTHKRRNRTLNRKRARNGIYSEFQQMRQVILLKAISHIHRNRTEKLECLKVYDCFHIYSETKTGHRTENIHEFDFFFGSSAEVQQIRHIYITPVHIHNRVRCI